MHCSVIVRIKYNASYGNEKTLYTDLAESVLDSYSYNNAHEECSISLDIDYLFNTYLKNINVEDRSSRLLLLLSKSITLSYDDIESIIDCSRDSNTYFLDDYSYEVTQDEKVLIHASIMNTDFVWDYSSGITSGYINDSNEEIYSNFGKNLPFESLRKTPYYYYVSIYSPVDYEIGIPEEAPEDFFDSKEDFYAFSDVHI